MTKTNPTIEDGPEAFEDQDAANKALAECVKVTVDKSGITTTPPPGAVVVGGGAPSGAIEEITFDNATEEQKREMVRLWRDVQAQQADAIRDMTAVDPKLAKFFKSKPSDFATYSSPTAEESEETMRLAATDGKFLVLVLFPMTPIKEDGSDELMSRVAIRVMSDHDDVDAAIKAAQEVHALDDSLQVVMIPYGVIRILPFPKDAQGVVEHHGDDRYQMYVDELAKMKAAHAKEINDARAKGQAGPSKAAEQSEDEETQAAEPLEPPKGEEGKLYDELVEALAKAEAEAEEESEVEDEEEDEEDDYEFTDVGMGI